MGELSGVFCEIKVWPLLYYSYCNLETRALSLYNDIIDNII